MKRVIMIMAIATSVSFATQAINPVEKTINPQEVVTQDEFVVIEVKDLPAPVVESIRKTYAESVIKKAFITQTEKKTYKVIVVTADQKEVTVLLNEKGEVVE
ncbi:MAG: hypothetical protein PHY27_08655 [Parabacteroides sp.]|uniref:Uncharacterized protein n=1 Tax=Macellibacteroides fermentans TaxID=879969 RepID=A0A8E1ZZR6_9PORP|nr:hypothetical protein [Macellibacteroides fermentans]MDD3508480.1 hypothetical protein [Parabacteroides sp.]MDD4418842.1 hypothetical protein [Bacteroides graminisolvens]NYI48213.1 hypothetical protein [Macellibacteroides fermentans]OCW93223.1 hypothetical protein A9168_12495 [Macellibacteroides sp. HH-ZS]